MGKDKHTYRKFFVSNNRRRKFNNLLKQDCKFMVNPIIQRIAFFVGMGEVEIFTFDEAESFGYEIQYHLVKRS